MQDRDRPGVSFQRLNDLLREELTPWEAADHRKMLESLRDDRKEKNVHYLGMLRAPAAKGNHHAFEGGLVYHYLEMWEVWKKSMMREVALREGHNSHINDSRILKGIIYHDLHKAFCTYALITEEPWQTDYVKHETDQLMTPDVKTLWILQDHGIKLDPEQMNAVCWAEGGFSKIRPEWTSVLSKILYMLDETSGNVLGRLHTKTLLSHRQPME